MKLGRRRKIALSSTALLAVAAAVALWPFDPPTRLSAPPSTVVTWSDGSVAHVFLAPDERYRIAARRARIDPDFLEALVRFEDKRFFSHPGVDPLAVMRSAFVNARHGQVLTGASTLTMQLIRLAEPRPRTVVSKVVEAWRALRLEHSLDKSEILDLYLTFTPFGGNLEGVEAASWAYFGHGADALAPDEIAVLLAVPQRPSQRSPSPRNRERLRQARDEIGAWLVEQGLTLGDDGREPDEILAEIRAAPIPARARPLPRSAHHAARWLRDRGGAATRVASTLDRGVQLRAESLLAAAAEGHRAVGIRHGAIVVVDHRLGDVAALVGGPDFWRDDPGAQIPAFDARRSVGSTLKPWIYADAIDRGLIVPERLLSDVPRVWGDWVPENYDRRHRGLVAAEEALSSSLNLPFVELLGRLGVERFVGSLRHAGLDGLDSVPGHYGLSAAVGGIEASPLEMAGVYTTLANGGVARPIRLFANRPRSTGIRLFSPGSAWLTRRALRRRDRPDFPRRSVVAGVPFDVHWKTGTSAGHRDAWAVGSGPRYTVVVWLGNLDRTPAFDLVGAEAAGPILFRMLESIESAEPRRDRTGPTADLARVEVCDLSGHRPGTACPRRARALAPRASVPPDPCPYHVLVDVDAATGLAVHPGCRGDRRWTRRSFVRWPAATLRFLGGSLRRHAPIPTLLPGCDSLGINDRFDIAWPPPGEEIVLVPGRPAGAQEVPFQVRGPEGTTIDWFVDGHHVGRADAGEVHWWRPTAGKHEVTAVGPSGRAVRRTVTVRPGPSRRHDPTVSTTS